MRARLKHLLGTLRTTAPGLARVIDGGRQWAHLRREATRCLRATEGWPIAEKIDFLYARGRTFSPWQKRDEILRLLELLLQRPPARMCEIGGALGGTLLLFSHCASDEATIVSIDRAYTFAQRRVFERFARKGQTVRCLAADSQNEKTVGALKTHLGGDPLDFLFIDGDHSYAGVTADFRLYSPLVRPGGLIAFHDIVPDARTLSGLTSEKGVGDVPRFWVELKARYRGWASELIEDPKQDGFGIGVLTWYPRGRVEEDA
ncbi:MAG TPA: CmcI family methyltransferase [Candidatus Methylomirabilis sp.]|nr:CmcI family methyltransferase [Candidatus Methylomirabilis sp.]